MTTGEQLKLDGQSATIAAATNAYQDHGLVIRSAMFVLARRGIPFAACDVRKLLPLTTIDALATRPGLMGSCFTNMRREGTITRIGTTMPTRKERHGNPNGQWIGAHT